MSDGISLEERGLIQRLPQALATSCSRGESIRSTPYSMHLELSLHFNFPALDPTAVISGIMDKDRSRYHAELTRVKGAP